MIVYCSSLGSLWFRKSYESGSTAWFNTTGIRRSLTSSRVRRRWTFQGSVRFNADQFPWVRTPGDLLGKRYFCRGIEMVEDETRLLCERPANKNEHIDAFLVCIRSDEIGIVERERDWKSRSARLIASSGGRSGAQEMLLLVHKHSWILTDQGYWKWEIKFSRSGRPRLELAPANFNVAEFGREL